MTRVWAAEFGAQGIRVNAISPGVIAPPNVDPGDFPGAALMAGSPAGAAGDPDSIAAAAVCLASDDARFIHGTVLTVGGGRAGVHLAAAEA